MRLLPAHLPFVRDLRTVAVVVVTCSVVLAAPSVAAKLKNADTVDHRSAVGAGASSKARAGKLVATDKSGHLPSNIIKAKPTAPTVPVVARPGTVQTGVFSSWGGGANSYTSDAVTFGSRLPFPIPPNRITYVPEGGPTTAECPGVGTVGPVGSGGWLCVYEENLGGQTFDDVFQPDTPNGLSGVSVRGFAIYYSCTSTACYAYGNWAVKAPSVAPTRTATRGVTPGVRS